MVSTDETSYSSTFYSSVSSFSSVNGQKKCLSTELLLLLLPTILRFCTYAQTALCHLTSGCLYFIIIFVQGKPRSQTARLPLACMREVLSQLLSAGTICTQRVTAAGVKFLVFVE